MKNKKETGKSSGKPKESMLRSTIMPGKEEIERMPDSDDDYRLPRDLPEAGPEPAGANSEEESTRENLTDDRTEIAPEELELLDSTSYDSSSDESASSDLLDDEDDDGDELNEGPGEDSLFDTGEDLDMPRNITNPDADKDEEEP